MKKLLAFIILLTVACNDKETDSELKNNSTWGVTSLVKRNERNRDACGITYNSRAEAPCPFTTVDRQLKNVRTCGDYKFGPNPACSGSLPEENETVTSKGTCRVDANEPACKSGFHSVARRQRTGHSCSPHVDRDVVLEIQIDCKKPAFHASCRTEANGIEVEKTCRHPSHGKERALCADPSFGHTINQCQFYLTPGETSNYLAEAKRRIPSEGYSLITAKSTYYRFKRDTNAMGCFIKTYETDPLYQSLVDEMKVQYVLNTAQDPTGDIRIDCDRNKVPDITKETCTDSSVLCMNVKVYKEKKHYLNTVLGDLANLSSDVAARTNSQIKSQIQVLINDANGQIGGD